LTQFVEHISSVKLTFITY